MISQLQNKVTNTIQHENSYIHNQAINMYQKPSA
jgi:hypothetical protein